MSEDKVAIVTGSNKGIGFAVVKGLCERFSGVVYLTSRNEEKGYEAVNELKKQAYSPEYHQLDVSDKESVKCFGDYIKEKHGGIDILINNAGVSGAFENSYDGKKSVIDINYGGLLNVEEFLFPLLRDNARVVNISSDCGHLSNIRNKEWIERLSKKDLTRNDIEAFVNWYLDSEKNGTFKRHDFADYGSIAAYRVSKVAMSALTTIQQRELESRGIRVNSMHPGLVSTDMSMHIGFLTPEESAETPLYLALEAPSGLKGKYIWYDKMEVDWYDYKSDCYFKTSSMGTTLIKNVIKYPFKLLPFPAIWVGVLSIGLLVVITKLNNDLVDATGF